MIKRKYYYNFFSFISFFLLFFFSFLVYKYFLKSEPSIVNFYNNELSSEFEMDIANNLENLERFFENYTFIEKYLINRGISEILSFNECMFISKTFNPCSPLNFMSNANSPKDAIDGCNKLIKTSFLKT